MNRREIIIDFYASFYAVIFFISLTLSILFALAGCIPIAIFFIAIWMILLISVPIIKILEWSLSLKKKP